MVIKLLRIMPVRTKRQAEVLEKANRDRSLRAAPVVVALAKRALERMSDPAIERFGDVLRARIDYPAASYRELAEHLGMTKDAYGSKLWRAISRFRL